MFFYIRKERNTVPRFITRLLIYIEWESKRKRKGKRSAYYWWQRTISETLKEFRKRVLRLWPLLNNGLPISVQDNRQKSDHLQSIYGNLDTKLYCYDLDKSHRFTKTNYFFFHSLPFQMTRLEETLLGFSQ